MSKRLYNVYRLETYSCDGGEVKKCKIYVGQTGATSKGQACNNVRYRTRGKVHACEDDYLPGDGGVFCGYCAEEA